MGVQEYRAVVSDFTFAAISKSFDDLNPPKYWTCKVDEEGNIINDDDDGNPIKIGDPYAQIDTSTEIPSCDDGEGNCNCRDDGY